jgi:hypothetical protein
VAEEKVSYIASISPRDIAFSLGRPDRIPTQITLMDITECPPYSRESAGNAVGVSAPVVLRLPRTKKRLTRRVWALVQLRPQNHHPDQPAAHTHRLLHTLGQVGEQYGPSIAPFARARCQFPPLSRPYSPGGAARGSHTGQFSYFGPPSCFIASALDIPNEFWPLDRAVGMAYIRETAATPSRYYAYLS